MPVDPRLNCAAEICCPPTGLGDEAAQSPSHEARVAILMDLGLGRGPANEASRAMRKRELCFMPQALADTMREIAFPAKSE